MKKADNDAVPGSAQADPGSGVNLPTVWKKPRRISDPPPKVAKKLPPPAPGGREPPVLPAVYIFPATVSGNHREWPVMQSCSLDARRVGMILLNSRFKVTEICKNWARVRLQSGTEGWAIMALAYTWHLVPYNPDLHSELKPLQGRSSRAAAAGPSRSNKTANKANKATDLLALFFGKREEPRMLGTMHAWYQPGPRKGPSSVSARRTTSAPSSVGPIARHFPPAAEHPGTGAAAVVATPASTAATVAVYSWQKHRGNANQEMYVATLEARREALRGFDLSLDDNAALLAEWMELIKERDVVLRYKFSTQVAQERDVRRPRSNSFFGSPDKMAKQAANKSPTAPSGGGGAAPPPAVADGAGPRRRRSNSFADNSPRQMIFTQTVSSLDAGATPGPAPGPDHSIPPADGASPTTPSPPPPPGRSRGSAVLAPSDGHSAAASVQPAVIAPADSPRTVWSNASAPRRSQDPSGLCVAVPTLVVPAVVSTTGGGTRCKHGNDPTACKYGDCPAHHIKARSPPSLAKATRYGSDGGPATPAKAATPLARHQRGAAADAANGHPPGKASICKHGNVPGKCKYGTCAKASPKAIVGAPAAAGPTAGAPPAMCKHGNNSATCKYGACADARAERATFEKMVQEELQKLRDESSSSSAADLAAICTLATPAAAPSLATPAATVARPAPAVDVRLAAGLAHATTPAAAATPATALPPVLGQMVATGGKRTVKRKIKRRVAGAAAPAPAAIGAVPAPRQASPKKVVRRLDFAAKRAKQTKDAAAMVTAAANPAAQLSSTDSGTFSPVANAVAARKLAFGAETEQPPRAPVTPATNTPPSADSEATPMTRTAAELAAELVATKPGLGNGASRIGATPSPTEKKPPRAPDSGPANVARSLLFVDGLVEDEGSSEWL